jgi:hypothetical protein
MRRGLRGQCLCTPSSHARCAPEEGGGGARWGRREVDSSSSGGQPLPTQVSPPLTSQHSFPAVRAQDGTRSAPGPAPAGTPLPASADGGTPAGPEPCAESPAAAAAWLLAAEGGRSAASPGPRPVLLALSARVKVSPPPATNSNPPNAPSSASGGSGADCAASSWAARNRAPAEVASVGRFAALSDES